MATSMERGRAGLRTQQIEVEGLSITYTEGGSGPTLLLVHGFNADKDNWTRMAAALTDDYRVVALDLPGFGESTRDPALRHDIVSQTERLKAFHDALELGVVHLAGNSMGGEISAVYATRYPEDVGSLTLINAAGVTSPEPSEMATRLAAGDNPLIANNAEEYTELLAFVFVEPPWIPGVVVEHFASVAIDNRPFTEQVWRDLRASPSNIEASLGDIQAPTLILWGDTDRVLHVSGAAVYDAGIPSSEVVIMERMGHIPMVERPEETAGHLRAFLDQHTSR